MPPLYCAVTGILDGGVNFAQRTERPARCWTSAGAQKIAEVKGSIAKMKVTLLATMIALAGIIVAAIKFIG